MFRNILSLGCQLASRSIVSRNLTQSCNLLKTATGGSSIGSNLQAHGNLIKLSPLWQAKPLTNVDLIGKRNFHAAGSKTKYLDFRYRFPTNHLRLHLLIIRRKKMKKHKLRKFRRKFKCLLAKKRLKREIEKEKFFRVELLSMIRKAEQFNPKEYALKCIAEINNQPKVLSAKEKREELLELVRKNRYQVDYIKPVHRAIDWPTKMGDRHKINN